MKDYWQKFDEDFQAALEHQRRLVTMAFKWMMALGTFAVIVAGVVALLAARSCANPQEALAAPVEGAARAGSGLQALWEPYPSPQGVEVWHLSTPHHGATEPCRSPGGDDPSLPCPGQVTRASWRPSGASWRASRILLRWHPPPGGCLSLAGPAKCGVFWWTGGTNEDMLGYLMADGRDLIFRHGWRVPGQPNKSRTDLKLPRGAEGPYWVELTAFSGAYPDPFLARRVVLRVRDRYGVMLTDQIISGAICRDKNSGNLIECLPAEAFRWGRRGKSFLVDFGFTGSDNPAEGTGGDVDYMRLEVLP